MSTAKRIDLHTHSIFSDGELLPSELLRRASALGHAAVAITDHADASNMELVIGQLRRLLEAQPTDFAAALLIGIELTHVAPASIDPLARHAKDLGAEVVVVHGETIVEPVAPGTNLAAARSPAVDVLAHPGLITPEVAQALAERDALCEITARKGHCLTNGHVARICIEAGTKMVVNTDAHAPSDLATLAFARAIAEGAGLGPDLVDQATIANPRRFVERILAARD
ncbi:MAG: histidinol phosphate phosphatase domain-containing protein [Anaerolineae bacterium]